MPSKREADEHRDVGMSVRETQSPYKTDEWRRLSPAERLRRSWQMRTRLVNPRAVHDRKLFPNPD